MRPVNIPGNPPHYNDAAEKDRNSAVYEEDDVTGDIEYYTREEAADELQSLINDWVTRGMPTRVVNRVRRRVWRDDDQAENYDLFKDQVGSGYGNARGDLITAVGQYCSYCETPILTNAHVEHVLPKNSFPAVALDWSNFLVACPSCNSVKGDTPTQWINGQAVATLQAEVYLRNPQHYLWPNTFWPPAPNGAALPFRVVLSQLGLARRNNHEFGAQNWVWGPDVPHNQYLTLAIQMKRGELKVENGRWTAPGEGRAKIYYGARIIPNPASTQVLQQAATAIINMTSLNNLVSDAENESIDRRVELRTAALLEAAYMRDLLQKAGQMQNAGIGIYNDVRLQMTNAMIARGFWTAWATVLGDLNGMQHYIAGQFPGTAPRLWTFY